MSITSFLVIWFSAQKPASEETSLHDIPRDVVTTGHDPESMGMLHPGRDVSKDWRIADKCLGPEKMAQ